MIQYRKEKDKDYFYCVEITRVTEKIAAPTAIRSIFAYVDIHIEIGVILFSYMMVVVSKQVVLPDIVSTQNPKSYN